MRSLAHPQQRKESPCLGQCCRSAARVMLLLLSRSRKSDAATSTAVQARESLHTDALIRAVCLARECSSSRKSVSVRV
jgi:hypothetical protein